LAGAAANKAAAAAAAIKGKYLDIV